MSLIHAKGNGGTYPYFFCIGRMHGTGCVQPYVPVEPSSGPSSAPTSALRLPQEQADLVREKLNEALAGMQEESRSGGRPRQTPAALARQAHRGAGKAPPRLLRWGCSRRPPPPGAGRA